MNHPQREDWMPYFFGEGTSETRQQLRNHLQSCPECRAEIARWKRTLRRLDAWKLPRPGVTHEGFAPFFRWAIAGALMLGIGFTVGRFTSPVTDIGQLRAAIEPELRRELRAHFARSLQEDLATSAASTLAASAEQTKSWLAEYARAFNAKLDAERTERTADCLSLKQDIDTLAVNADASLRHTQQRLALLAQYPQPSSTPTDKNPVHQ